jgi:hypothetical protein
VFTLKFLEWRIWTLRHCKVLQAKGRCGRMSIIGIGKMASN